MIFIVKIEDAKLLDSITYTVPVPARKDMVFWIRVTPLHWLALTPPYKHDGYIQRFRSSCCLRFSRRMMCRRLNLQSTTLPPMKTISLTTHANKNADTAT